MTLRNGMQEQYVYALCMCVCDLFSQTWYHIESKIPVQGFHFIQKLGRHLPEKAIGPTRAIKRLKA